MICGNCGAKLAGTERFCPHCGKAIYRAAPESESARNAEFGGAGSAAETNAAGSASSRAAFSAAQSENRNGASAGEPAGYGGSDGSPAPASRRGKPALRLLAIAGAAAAVLTLALGAARLLQAPQRFDDPLLLAGQYIQTMQQERPTAGYGFLLPQAADYYRRQGLNRRRTMELADSALAADLYSRSDGWELVAQLPWDSEFYGSLFDELGAEVLEGQDVLLRFTAGGVPLDAPQFCAELVRTPQGWFLLSVYKI